MARLTGPQAWALHGVLADHEPDDLTEVETTAWELAYEAGRRGRPLTLTADEAAALRGAVLAYDEPDDWPAREVATLRRALDALT